MRTELREGNAETLPLVRVERETGEDAGSERLLLVAFRRALLSIVEALNVYLGMDKKQHCPHCSRRIK